jgi:hypothetical protein
MLRKVKQESDVVMMIDENKAVVEGYRRSKDF